MTPRSNALERPQSEAKAPSRALDACPTALKAHREILVLARRGHQIFMTLAVISLLTLINFNAQQMARIPNVAYHVRLLSFLYLSMFFCAVPAQRRCCTWT